MELKMEVYSPQNLELLGVLEQYRSVIWEDKAFSAGSFSLEALLTKETLALLVPENIIWIEGNTAGIIEYIQEKSGEDGPYITVKGRLLTGILDRRILWGRYDLSGTASSIMRELVKDCAVAPTRGETEARKLPNLTLLDISAEGESIRKQQTGGTLLEALEEIGETHNTAFGIQFNAETPGMEFWARVGENRTVNQIKNEPVFYSTELDDVLSSEYSYDSTNYRNISVVAGEGEGDNRVMVTVQGNTGTSENPPTPPDPPTPPEPVQYTVSLSVDPEGGGTASGGGMFEDDTSVTVSASAAVGYSFVGWQENGTIISSNASFTFTISGNRNLTAVFAAETGLPSSYTELQYVQLHSPCGIDTGVKQVGNKTRFVADLECPTNITFYTYIAASLPYLISGNTNYRQFLLMLTEANRIDYDDDTGGTYTQYITAPSVGKRLTIDFDFYAGTISVGSVKQSLKKGNYTVDENIFIGVPQSNWQSTDYKLYSVQIYNGTQKIRDFIPCKNSSGTAGLYDLIGRKFYKNSFSGSLTAGPEA